MTSLDLDPLFVKALRLLHSRSKDSTDQLREMVDEAITQRRAQLKGLEIEKKQKQDEDPMRKRENEKKQLEKLKQDLSDLSQEAPSKKPRAHSPSPEKNSSAKDKEQEREREKEKERMKKEKEARERREAEKKEKIKQEREREKEREREREREKERKKKEGMKKIEDSDSDQGMDADDIAFGLGISCVVCRQFDVTSSNKLIECQECHNLYHQECHKPPVVEQDVDDPRFVWYCTRCAKNMKKIVQSKTSKPKPMSSQPVSAFTKEMTTLLKPPKTESASSLLFRRAEPKTSSKEPSAAPSSKPLSGLAGLAANLAGKVTTDSSKPHSAKGDPSKPRPDPFKALGPGRSEQSERQVTPGVSLLKSTPKPMSEPSKSLIKTGSNPKPAQGGSMAANADKRLQQMKKKAAAKMQEKRTR